MHSHGVAPRGCRSGFNLGGGIFTAHTIAAPAIGERVFGIEVCGAYRHCDRLAYHHLGGLHRATGGRGQSRSSAPVEDQAGTESDAFGVWPPQGSELGASVVGEVMVRPDEICFEQTETEPLSYGQVHSATQD